jgi:hypothetical protein
MITLHAAIEVLSAKLFIPDTEKAKTGSLYWGYNRESMRKWQCRKVEVVDSQVSGLSDEQSLSNEW